MSEIAAYAHFVLLKWNGICMWQRISLPINFPKADAYIQLSNGMTEKWFSASDMNVMSTVHLDLSFNHIFYTFIKISWLDKHSIEHSLAQHDVHGFLVPPELPWMWLRHWKSKQALSTERHFKNAITSWSSWKLSMIFDWDNLQGAWNWFLDHFFIRPMCSETRCWHNTSCHPEWTFCATKRAPLLWLFAMHTMTHNLWKLLLLFQ